MADQKKVTRRGTRAMLHPKPDRVRKGADPFKPRRRPMPPPHLRGEI